MIRVVILAILTSALVGCGSSDGAIENATKEQLKKEDADRTAKPAGQTSGGGQFNRQADKN